ncbi:MAG: hypothetical protein GY862_38085 [Gammaproteobacteria bacterium]|nr:hypothetical protein [Gammaproteobacteria bacterium]
MGRYRLKCLLGGIAVIKVGMKHDMRFKMERNIPVQLAKLYRHCYSFTLTTLKQVIIIMKAIREIQTVEDGQIQVHPKESLCFQP